MQAAPFAVRVVGSTLLRSFSCGNRSVHKLQYNWSVFLAKSELNRLRKYSDATNKMEKTALDTRELLFEEFDLFVPPLKEVKSVIEVALKANFDSVSVELTQCPDLTTTEFGGLKDVGLGGKPTLLEVGGPTYLLPLVQRSKLYNMKDIVEDIMGGRGAGKVLAIGAGAGPFPLRGTNCEGIYNFSISKEGRLENGSYTAKVVGAAEECILERIPDEEHRCALLLNLFLCRGEVGRVLRVVCKKRIGEQNFIECIRKGLADKYKEKCVGMGGIFMLRRGRAHQHVMRDFSETPINTEEGVNEWLKFYDMPAQLNAVGTLVTHEHNLDLRLQHFHSFSNSNWGGHYHYDTTPDTVEYEAYFNVAERVVRVDRPLQSHKMGRD